MAAALGLGAVGKGHCVTVNARACLCVDNLCIATSMHACACTLAKRKTDIHQTSVARKNDIHQRRPLVCDGV